MTVIQKIADFAGLTPLVVEVVFLLFLAILFTVLVLLVLTIFRIKYELIKMNYTFNYIARFLERGYKNRKLHNVNYDRESEDMVFDLLQQGKSHEEIMKEIRVSKEYIEIIEEVAIEKGLLAPRKQW